MIKKIHTRVVEKGPGFSKLLETLNGLAHITIGVQGNEALLPHPNGRGLTVGAVAAIHELGLAPGAPRRSWLAEWVDKNRKRMIFEAKAVYADVIKGKVSRKKGAEALGYKWVTEIRAQFPAGDIKPALGPWAGGRRTPLYDTASIHDAITYKVYLPRWKNTTHTPGPKGIVKPKLPPESDAVGDSPQPQKAGRRIRAPKQNPRNPPRHGPRLPPRQNPRNPPKQGPKLPYGFRQGKYKPGFAKAKLAGRARKVKQGRTVLRRAKTYRKQTWAWKLLKKLARKILAGEKKGKYDGRNHGYSPKNKYHSPRKRR